MVAASISQAVYFRQEREDEYMRRIKKYDKSTVDLFPEMLAELVLEYEENGCHDVLGELYMELEMYNKWTGQYFTPAHIASAMSKLTEPSKNEIESEIERQGFIKVCDPACGSGVMLIEYANNCKELGINYQKDVLFVAVDIDSIVALMCYIQMSLLGMPGIVCIANTLSGKPYGEPESRWFTPMYITSGFVWRKQKSAAPVPNGDIKPHNVAETATLVPNVGENPEISRETDGGQFEIIFD